MPNYSKDYLRAREMSLKELKRMEIIRDGDGRIEAGTGVEVIESVESGSSGVSGRPYVPWSVGCVRPLDSPLGATLREEDYVAISESVELQAEEIVRCEVDCWYWRMNYVWTNDEHWVMKGKSGPYQRWPVARETQVYCDMLFRYPRLGIPKARQRKITWLVSTQMLGDALFTGGRLYMIQSKREADAKKVLRRMHGVYERMRSVAPWLGPGLKRCGESELVFTNDSVIMAVPQGANYVQSHTPAWWFADEAQLQDEIEEAYYQALPACERITLAGTTDYGWFCQIFLRDDIDGSKGRVATESDEGSGIVV